MHGIRWASLLEDNPLTVMDRIRWGANVYLTQAVLNTITYRVFQYDSYEDLILDRNGSEVGSQASVTIATSVFDTLQTDSYWTKEDGSAVDAIGYNFRFTIPIARFPTAAKWYRVEFTFTPGSGSAWKTVWGVNTSAIASS